MNLLLISGTRRNLRPTHSDIIIARLNQWEADSGSSRTPKLVMHGACGWAYGQEQRKMKGVDAVAHYWAQRRRGVMSVPMLVNWDFGLKDGPNRNQDMVVVARTMRMRGWKVTVLAYPLGESRGTRSFIRAAELTFRDIEVHELGGQT